MSEIKFPRSGKVRDAVLAYLAKHPGLTAEELASAVNHNLVSVRCALSKLASDGVAIARYRKGREFVYTLIEHVSGPVKEPEAQDKDQIAALLARIAELEAQLAGKTPTNYEAYREVLATYYDHLEMPCVADELRDGEPIHPLDEQYIDALIEVAPLVVAVQGDA